MREYDTLTATGPRRLTDALNQRSAQGRQDFRIEKVMEVRNGDLMAIVSWESEDPMHVHDD